MTIVRDILDRNIEQNIAPVVYFHKQDQDDIEKEVREYVITTRHGSGGEAGGGIHEQYVSLLNQISSCIETKETSLPASWISGFFGSGKSSFAKLLGLAFDGKKLSDGTPLSEALLKRDDTPNAQEFKNSWERLNNLVKPMAVVFDIGAVSRSDELINKTVYREVQKRLGYSDNDQIAHFELLLEEERKYDTFLSICQEKFNVSWDELKNKKIAPQRFSSIYSEIYNDEYPEPMDWFDIHQSDVTSDAQSVQASIKGIKEMMNRRASGKSLFIVIDEMSQYIGIDQRKMLDMQTFVSELGAELEGKVWLLVTGQERLSDVNESTVIGKMRDRFPPRLRVHLDRANVKEIVYRRLLKKKDSEINKLQTILDSSGTISKLKLEGYECDQISKESIIDHYPLLPAHINLLMDISQGIRNSSTRIQADSGSVRGVLQIIWELFNHSQVNFKERNLGDLVTLDNVYDILRSALNSDTLLTMDKIEEHSKNDPFKFKVAKAIALLEMVQESQPTTDKLIASVLYPSLGADSILDKVKDALQMLEAEHFIISQEKLGWRIQDHAGQDWIRTRDDISISSDKINDTLFHHLSDLMGTVEKPRLYGTPLPWNLWKGANEKLSGRVDFPAVNVDFRFITSQRERNDTDSWVSISKESSFRQRFIWVCGDHNDIYNLIRNVLRSEKMIEKHDRTRLDRAKERQLIEEKARKENLEKEIPKAVRTCWLNGELYFNGTAYKARDKGNTFEISLKTIVEENVDSIYHHFREGNLQISKDRDLEELFKPEITSPNPKFMEGSGGLGLISLDSGKVSFTASGAIPSKIKELLQNKHSMTGDSMVSHFGMPPYGYPRQVIKACLIALLRSEIILVRDVGGSELTSYKDPGTKDVFLNESNFNRCDIIHNREPEIGAREKVIFANFFKEYLNKEVLRENEAIADSIFNLFSPLQNNVEQKKEKLRRLGLKVPKKLNDFTEALSKCRQDRKVQTTLVNFRSNLEILKEGIILKNELEENLTESTEQALSLFQKTLINEVKQLEDYNVFEEIQDDVTRLENQLNNETPWRSYADILPIVDTIKRIYKEKRNSLLLQQDNLYKESIERIKKRNDFSLLSTEQKNSVIRTIESILFDTTENDLQPSLIVLKTFSQKLENSEAKAHDMIDEFLTPQEIDEIVKISINSIKNRTMVTESDLNTILDELRDKVFSELRNGKKVRFI